MRVVIRRGRNWYKDKVGESFDVEDEVISIGGIERYRLIEGGRVRWVRVEDALPIRPGLASFIDHHKHLLEADEAIINNARNRPLLARMVSEKKDLLAVIEVMAPVFEERYQEAVRRMEAKQNEKEKQND